MYAFVEYLQTMAMEPSMMIQNIVTVLDVMIIFGREESGGPNYKRLGAEFLFLLSGLVICNGIWQVIFGSQGSFFVTHLLIILVSLIWNGRIRQRQAMISALLFYGIEIGMISLSAAVPLAIEHLPAGSVLEIYIRNGAVLLTIVIAYFFRRFPMYQFRNIPGASLAYAFLMSSVVFILSLWYQGVKSALGNLGNQFALLAFSSFLLVALLAYYLSYAVCVHTNAALSQQAEKIFARSDGEILKISKQNLEEIRRIRHDIRNHFAYMNVMLQEKRYEELEHYFQELDMQVVKPLSRIDCGNRNISAILNLEASKAHVLGIQLDCRVAVSPQLPFQDHDLCGLLTNLIDNALEACERFQINNGVVEVGINQKPNMLYISVLNPVDVSKGEEKLLSLRTTKASVEEHGYGSQIIELIVKKYNGEINRSVERGKYIVDLMLDLNWRETLK